MILAAAAAAVALAAPHAPAPTLTPCVVNAVDARCGTMVVPENRAKPGGRTVALRVVVLPSRRKPARPDAFTYIAGGPGGASSDVLSPTTLLTWSAIHERHDILLVDQRGTGASNPLSCAPPKTPLTTKAQLRAYVRACLASFNADITQYGTRTAMDDLDAVRAALGYKQLDVEGGSYGATAAQVYLRRHRSSVRTIVLEGATALGVSFYGHFAVNAERALAQVTKRCAADAICARAFPHWRTTLGALIRAWDEHPARTGENTTMTGTRLTGVVQTMLLGSSTAASIPLMVSRAAERDYRLLNKQVAPGAAVETQQLMHWSILCNEPWVGLDAKGPWHTIFDDLTTSQIAQARAVCAFIPRRAEPPAAWTLLHSGVPLLAIAGGADPQDPISNLGAFEKSFPNSRAIVVPGEGHFGLGFESSACLGDVISRFVDRGTVKGLDTSCVGALLPPPMAIG